MAALTFSSLLAFLRQNELLSSDQLEELAEQPHPEDVAALLRELVRREWLTEFQVNQIAHGNGKELVLGSYRLLEPIGEGGMGKVFKARNVRMDRIVALKIMPQELLENPQAMARFNREVRAVAQLSHPNIVTAYEVNQEGDTHYFAMEFMEGIDLGKLVRQSGTLPIRQACDYIRQAALGLQHAHEKGLVHRDIKPGNLIVGRTTAGGNPVVKILDFGLARFETPNQQITRLTKIGHVIGTVDYISPEQAGDARGVDIRADIYSLGCSLFFLLTGKPPFDGADSMERAIARVVNDAPSVRTTRPGVPLELDKVLARMLARNPADRYSIPAEVAAALEPFVPQPPPTRPQELGPTKPLCAAKSEQAPVTVGSSLDSGQPRSPEPKHEASLQRKRIPPRMFAWSGAVAVGMVLVMAFLWMIFLRSDSNQPTSVAVVGPGSDKKPSFAEELVKPKLIKLDPENPPPTKVSKAKVKPKTNNENPAKVDIEPKIDVRLHEHGGEVIYRTSQGSFSSNVALFSPKGRYVAFQGGNSGDYRFFVWDLTEKKLAFASPASKANGWTNAVFSPDETRLVVAGNQGNIAYQWDLTRKVQMHPLKHAGPGPIGVIAYSADGKFLLTGAREGKTVQDYFLNLWDADNGTLVRHFNNVPLADSFSGDTKTFYFIAFKGNVSLWNRETGELSITVPAGYETRQSFTIRLCPPGWRGLFRNPRGLVLVDIREGRIVKNLGRDFRYSSWSPDGRLLALTPNDISVGDIYVKSTETGKLLGILKGENMVFRMAFSWDNNYLLSIDGQTVRLWNLGELMKPIARGDISESELSAISWKTNIANNMAISTAGNLCLTAGSSVELWGLPDGKLLKKLHGTAASPPNGIGNQAFTPDGQKAAVNPGGSGAVILWDLVNLQPIGKLKPSNDPIAQAIYALTFSPDAKLLIWELWY